MFKSFAVLAATAYATETIVFEDTFDTFDFTKWQHEITLGGGGNNEFEMYLNNRKNSWVENGVLYLQPTLTADEIGANALASRKYSIWGTTPADLCTGYMLKGCERTGTRANILNPIQSARLRTVNSFNFKYGRVEVRAQLPKGDWIWPAIWMLPTYNEYGTWPASGEIDIMESRGNSGAACSIGSKSYGSTLHWGPSWDQNRYYMTNASYTNNVSLGDDFHTYGLVWTEKTLYTYIERPKQQSSQR
jgi:beta-glucanase (GH16 family)